MILEALADWLKARQLDLHWSWTKEGDVCLTAIRDKDKRVWNGTASTVGDAVLLLKTAVETRW